MSLKDDFFKVFDKSVFRPNANFASSTGDWIVRETQNTSGCAPLCTLTIHIPNASFDSFGCYFLKNLPNITTDFSSLRKDKECDGFSFVTDDESESLFFAELKSTFSIQEFYKASCQLACTFFKFYALASCLEADVLSRKIHFIVACQHLRDENQKAYVASLVKDYSMLPEMRELYKLFQEIAIQDKNEATCDIPLGKFTLNCSDPNQKYVKELPFAQNIKEKQIHFTLKMTDQYGLPSADLYL